MSENCRTAHNTRILLIDCSRPLEKSKRTHYDVHQPPVGLLSIATAAWKAEIGRELEMVILDSTVDYSTLDEVKARIRDFRPHILGLRCLHVHTSQFHEITRYAKVVCKVPLVIAGGPYVTAEGPRVMKSDQFLDLVALGEGEATFVDIVTAFHSDRPITGIPGTLYRSNDDVVNGPARAPIADLDDIPIPDWSVIDFSKYSTMLNQAPVLRKCAPVMTSRGCPYSCTYCHKLFQKKTRLRSPEHVVNELQLLKSMGVNDISIIDDIFNLNGQRVREIFDLVSKRNLGQRLLLCEWTSSRSPPRRRYRCNGGWRQRAVYPRPRVREPAGPEVVQEKPQSRAYSEGNAAHYLQGRDA